MTEPTFTRLRLAPSDRVQLAATIRALGTTRSGLIRALLRETFDVALDNDGTAMEPDDMRLINDIRARARGRMG